MHKIYRFVPSIDDEKELNDLEKGDELYHTPVGKIWTVKDIDRQNIWLTHESGSWIIPRSRLNKLFRIEFYPVE